MLGGISTALGSFYIYVFTYSLSSGAGIWAELERLGGIIYLGEPRFLLGAASVLKWIPAATCCLANSDARHLRSRLKKWKSANFSVPERWNTRGGRSMKRLLVKAQAWYRPECASCGNLHTLKESTSGVKVAVAWCPLIEEGKPCNYEGEK